MDFYGICMDMYEIFMEYDWNMYGICMEYMKRMYWICMEHVQHMSGLCMQYVGGIGHGGCPARSLQGSRPPRTYRVHSAYSRAQKGDESLVRAWPAAIWSYGICR